MKSRRGGNEVGGVVGAFPVEGERGWGKDGKGGERNVIRNAKKNK